MGSLSEDLQPAYNEALRRGAVLAARLRPEDLEPDWREALTASAATFRAAYAEARAVIDPPEEGEEAV